MLLRIAEGIYDVTCIYKTPSTKPRPQGSCTLSCLCIGVPSEPSGLFNVTTETRGFLLDDIEIFNSVSEEKADQLLDYLSRCLSNSLVVDIRHFEKQKDVLSGIILCSEDVKFYPDYLFGDASYIKDVLSNKISNSDNSAICYSYFVRHDKATNDLIVEPLSLTPDLVFPAIPKLDALFAEVKQTFLKAGYSVQDKLGFVYKLSN